MENLEICKKLAEIEGLEHRVCESNQAVVLPQRVAEVAKINWVFNPLVDDKLCYQLMVKHKVDFISHDDEFEVMYVVLKDKPLENWNSVTDKNPNKAICLAIIKANEPN